MPVSTEENDELVAEVAFKIFAEELSQIFSTSPR